MTTLDLSTPALLFSAISLILLAYTNRFLSYASIVRQLKDRYDSDPDNDPTTLAQIENLVTRLKLIRAMQIFGASSLLFSTAAMFFIYMKWEFIAHLTFGSGMVMLAFSLLLCIWEIHISVEALNLRLISLKKAKENKGSKGKGQLFKKRKYRKPRKKKSPEEQNNQVKTKTNEAKHQN